MFDVEMKFNFTVSDSKKAKHIVKMFDRLYKKIPQLFDCSDVKKKTFIRPHNKIK